MAEKLTPTDPSRIGGHRLLARLGAGGMGVVYLGRAESGELAAVKVILPEYADQPEFRARFRREVAAARRVDSPWAVPVTGADPDAAAPWLATAFVPGPSLAEAVAACGPLPSRGVRVLGRMLARALTAVHEAGLVHRDVKPGNVLLAVDGPRLIDFGIARATEDTALTSADMVVGTPGFLAPEQARARPASPASDVFALGCLLAYAATGRPPFGTGAVDALLYRTVHDAPDLDGVPDDLRALLDACLAKDPAARPTAQTLDEALLQDTEDTPPGTADWLPDAVVRLIADRSAAMLALPDIEATSVDVATDGPATEVPEDAPPSPRPSRRRLLLLGGAAVLAAGGGTAWWASGRDDEPTPAGRRWVLGVQADLTGPQRAVGQAQEHGVRLAVEQFNSRQDKPFTLTLQVADDQGDQARATERARALAADRDLLAVIGSTGDATTGAALDAYDAQGVPQLTASSAQAVYGTAQPRSFLQAVPGYMVSPALIAFRLRDLGAKSAGVLIDRDGGQASWEIGHTTFQNLGVVEIPVEPRVVPVLAADLAPVVAEMTARKPDAFVYTGTPARAAAVARALAQRGFTGPRVLGYPAAEQEFLTTAGSAAEGWQTFAPYIDPAGAPVRAFTAAYRKRYGSAPPHWAAEAYDVARMVITRLTQTRVRPSRAQLYALLAKGTYKGLVRTYAFDGQTLKGYDVFRYEVKGGRFAYAGKAAF
ncbi:bifunctional serine/threonine-protein kinase/ABC transporter substrate-binding protein [Streptomyces sp. YU58]|uniref:bifunctional serine/threonine-protein kinase/ABC transporter substrate-binding protein n=1 Tax=Streptomyces sp. SX92 TaxID=3158972 RepID=UPI0027B9F014|nr:bifunctional serine/threonine-protein kinase/ABC transporter substrate-binding protein [Streptomyces coralus]WLW57578.1 bifunctional serine/threonine-protein kinase/ABC transporter substrate-binding protein [Streptomyces coralus]